MKFLLVFLFCFTNWVLASDHKQVRFGVNAFIPPYVIIDGDNFSGISVDILKAVFEKAKIDFKLEAVSNRRINELFISGDFTGALYLSEKKLGKTKVFLGPELIPFRNGFTCIEKKHCEEAFKAGNSLRMAGFQNASKVMGLEFKKLTESMENYTEVTNQKEQVMGLFSKRFDVVFGDERVIRYHIEHISNSSHLYSKKISQTQFLHSLYHHQTTRPVAFADEKTRDLFAKTYQNLKASGEVERIIQRYVSSK